MVLFHSSVPVSHDSVTIISLLTSVLFLLWHVKMCSVKKYRPFVNHPRKVKCVDKSPPFFANWTAFWYLTSHNRTNNYFYSKIKAVYFFFFKLNVSYMPQVCLETHYFFLLNTLHFWHLTRDKKQQQKLPPTTKGLGIQENLSIWDYQNN